MTEPKQGSIQTIPLAEQQRERGTEGGHPIFVSRSGTLLRHAEPVVAAQRILVELALW
jgi:hypothetical protein